MNIDNYLYTLKYTPDTISHLILDNEKCKNCADKFCTHVCPACVYEWNDDEQKIIVNYENCLECGACRIICPHKAINWQYPKGNKGVMFKQG